MLRRKDSVWQGMWASRGLLQKTWEIWESVESSAMETSGSQHTRRRRRRKIIQGCKRTPLWIPKFREPGRQKSPKCKRERWHTCRHRRILRWFATQWCKKDFWRNKLKPSWGFAGVRRCTAKPFDRFWLRAVTTKKILNFAKTSSCVLTHPTSKFPKKPPKQFPDAIHEASLIEIGPVSNGVSSDLKIGMLELAQPHVAP